MNRIAAVILLLLAAVALGQVTHRNDGGFVFQNPVNVTNVTYTGEYWDDSMVPALAIVGGSTAPGLISFATNDALKIYGFDGSGTPDDAYFTLQLPHRVKLGTTISPHVHWCRTSNPGAPERTNVVWELVYSFRHVNGAFTSGATNYCTNYIATTNWVHQVSDFPDITDAEMNLSSIMVGRIRRPSDNTSDTYDQDAGFLGFDVHYLSDSPGSRQEYVK